MSRHSQHDVRPAFAGKRAAELATPTEPRPTGALARRGRLLVLPSAGTTITLKAANAAVDASREGASDG